MKNETINNMENKLTDYQKDFFDFVIKQYKIVKKVEPTISQQSNLMNWIVKDYEINFTMISRYTGKVLSGDDKHSIMFVENMGILENILDW